MLYFNKKKVQAEENERNLRIQKFKNLNIQEFKNSKDDFNDNINNYNRQLSTIIDNYFLNLLERWIVVESRSQGRL